MTKRQSLKDKLANKKLHEQIILQSRATRIATSKAIIAAARREFKQAFGISPDIELKESTE